MKKLSNEGEYAVLSLKKTVIIEPFKAYYRKNILPEKALGDNINTQKGKLFL